MNTLRIAAACAALVLAAGPALAVDPTVTSISIVGPDTINAHAQMRAAYTAVANYSDGSTAPVAAGWSSFTGPVMMDQAGQATVNKLGIATITASSGGFTANKDVVVVIGAPASGTVNLECTGEEAPLANDRQVITVNVGTVDDILGHCDRHLLIASRLLNNIRLVNVATFEVVRAWPLNAAPQKMVRVPNTPYLFVTLNGSSAARVNLVTGAVDYIPIGSVQDAIVLGEPGEVWIRGGGVRRHDVQSLALLGTLNAGDVLMQYERRTKSLFTGNTGYSPGTLARYTYSAATGQATVTQSLNPGSNGQSLELSPNGRHLVYPNGGGNGNGYTIWDFDPSNLNQRYGEFNTGAYPRYGTFRFDSRKLLAANYDQVMLFDVTTHVNELSWVAPYGSSAIRIAWSPRGRNFYALQDMSVYPYTSNRMLMYGSLPAVFGLTVATTGEGGGSVVSNLGAIACGFDCVDGYDPGTTVVLTATPGLTSLFTGWSGDCDWIAGNQCTVTMDRTRGVTARFMPRPGPLSDLSGDLRSDLLFEHADGRLAAWTMNGTAPSATANILAAGTGWKVTHVADFNGDGKADLLFRHDDGRVYMYRMNGTQVTGGKELFGPGLGWRVSHVADLDGDGKADLVLRHDDGRAHLWRMDGFNIVGSASLLPAASGWRVVATGDLDADGKDDIVFMHDDGRAYLYLMDGTTVVGGAEFLSPGSGWAVSHVADVNADARVDLFFRHTDGRAHLFLMNGTSFGAGASILPAGSGWSITHTGDLNGDAKADIVFTHTDGRVHVRLMDATTILTAADVLAAGSGWAVTHLLDLNGDGKSDLVLRHADGSITVRLMDGLATLSTGSILGPGGWSVAPPQ